MDKFVSELLTALVLSGGPALGAWASRRWANLPRTIPRPRSFEEASGHIVNWCQSKAMPHEATSPPEGVTPIRAACFDMHPRPAEQLVAGVQATWRETGLLLLPMTRGSAASKGVPEVKARVGLYETTDELAVVRHIWPGYDGGVPDVDELVAWLKDLRAEIPFRITAVDGKAIDLEFVSPVADPQDLARLVALLVDDEPDEHALEDFETQIRETQSVTIYWD